MLKKISVAVLMCGASGAAFSQSSSQEDAVRRAINQNLNSPSSEVVIRAVPEQPAPAAPAVSGVTVPPKQDTAKQQASKQESKQEAAKKSASKMPARLTPPNWAYSGDRGPENWAKLSPGFAACGSGKFQSPIDIRDGFAVDLPELVLAYRPSSFSVYDNGNGLELRFADPGGFSVMGENFQLSRVLIKHPAEERVAGQTAAMSLQLIHVNERGQPAIVSVLLSAGETENPLVQAVLNYLPLVRYEPVSPPTATLDISQLFAREKGYYTYMGSLPYPPCTERVSWYVLKTPVSVSRQQVELISRLYPNNTRPVQPANNRLIKESRQLGTGR